MSHLSYSVCRVPVPTDPPLHVLLHPRRSTCRNTKDRGVSGMGHFPGAGDGEVICHGSQAFGVGVVAIVLSEAVLAETLAAFETAFAGLFADTTTAESGETGRETVAAAAALALLLLLRGRLLVLHGLLALWGTVVLALRGPILALGRAVGGLGVLGITSLVLVVVLVGHC